MLLTILGLTGIELGFIVIFLSMITKDVYYLILGIFLITLNVITLRDNTNYRRKD